MSAEILAEDGRRGAFSPAFDAAIAAGGARRKGAGKQTKGTTTGANPGRKPILPPAAGGQGGRVWDGVPLVSPVAKPGKGRPGETQNWEGERHPNHTIPYLPDGGAAGGGGGGFCARNAILHSAKRASGRVRPRGGPRRILLLRTIITPNRSIRPRTSRIDRFPDLRLHKREETTLQAPPVRRPVGHTPGLGVLLGRQWLAYDLLRSDAVCYEVLQSVTNASRRSWIDERTRGDLVALLPRR
jgi:hypothetical protein